MTTSDILQDISSQYYNLYLLGRNVVHINSSFGVATYDEKNNSVNIELIYTNSARKSNIRYSIYILE